MQLVENSALIIPETTIAIIIASSVMLIRADIQMRIMLETKRSNFVCFLTRNYVQSPIHVVGWYESRDGGAEHTRTPSRALSKRQTRDSIDIAFT